MIECVFTVDYEIYGDGTGSLDELVYEPGERLKSVFQERNARFVSFVEVAEFEKIETWGTDPGIESVRRQIRDFHQDGFEIGLHLHPQWCNARHQNGQWVLDYSEYNLCILSRERIAKIVEQSLGYLRYAVDESDFVPLSFRAGNWLFQPTETAASVLGENGIRIDSSVFKGGLQHNHTLDYRPALKNGLYWPFMRDVNEPDVTGAWIEVPIHTELVPFWRMATSKRLSFGNGFGKSDQSLTQRVNRGRDLLRFRYPLKLDFCRMTLNEMVCMIQRVIRQDRDEPDLYRPIVAIGHTKDLTDLEAVDSFLAFLHSNNIGISTFRDIYSKIRENMQLTGSI